VIKLSDPGLDAAQIKTADSLLDINLIDHSNLRYYKFSADSFATWQSLPYVDKTVWMDQYVNGLRIFNDEMEFRFPRGQLYKSIWHSPTKGTQLDTIPSLSLSQLRMKFTAQLLQYPYSTLPNATDSCYKAEFGYYNLSKVGEPEKLVKAWRVTIYSATATMYWPFGFGYPYDDPPIAYYEDNGGLIWFQPALPID
jgi:hypothetical protein